MLSLNNNIRAFLTLVRAGLWEQEVRFSSCDNVDFNEVIRYAEEQSVVGLVAAGIEHIVNVRVPQEIALQLAGQALQLEQRNIAMNSFIADVIEKMRNENIYPLIVKGQGIAQCYERPLWRASGDIDFFLSNINFLKARDFFSPLVTDGFNPNNRNARNISASLPPWDIELHADMFCELSRRIDQGIEEVQKCVLCEGKVRSWMNGRTQVFLPDADCDIIFVFTHFLKHFYKGGLGIRQVCDWCRLLWTYQGVINITLLEKRLRKMRVLSVWRAFATLSVEYLGMPIKAMPLYSPSEKWKRKARGVMAYMMEVGNMGHNRDMSYYNENNRLVRKIKSFGMRVSVLATHARLFPSNSIRFLPYMVYKGVKSYMRGE